MANRSLSAATAVLALCIALAPARPQAEPWRPADPAYRIEERATLLERLRTAETAGQAQTAEARIWEYWRSGAAPEHMARLRAAEDRRAEGDLAGSIALLDALVAEAPDYSEAWNQRAFSRFLAGDLTGSLDDIARTLEREPAHFGAIAGQARIHAARGEAGKAETALRRLAAIHPWMAGAARPTPPEARPEGEDL